jgi:hypothetical protein
MCLEYELRCPYDRFVCIHVPPFHVLSAKKGSSFMISNVDFCSIWAPVELCTTCPPTEGVSQYQSDEDSRKMMEQMKLLMITFGDTSAAFEK